jgi:hypothetical protein
MHCACCDKSLNPNEIRYNNLIGRWEYCNRCLEVANGLFPDIQISRSYSREEQMLKEYELSHSEESDGGIIESLEEHEEEYPSYNEYTGS